MVAQLAEVAEKVFDYVIIGAGTAGLTVAARLAEDPSVSVAVLEAGSANLHDPKLLLGGGFGSTWFDDKYDWGFLTTPQEHSNGRRWAWNRGKGLGGSSGMNFYAWVKPPAADVDAIEELGNPGWNWDSYQKYALRSENFTIPTNGQSTEVPFTYNKEFRGVGGPVQTTLPPTCHTTNKLFLDALGNNGVNLVDDPYGGDITGRFLISSHLDPNQNCTRSYSATSHYLPNKDKPNFRVLTDATVSRVILRNEAEGSDLVATGVEFIYGGETYTVNVRKEVVVAAGTIKSPQILELSGIGRRDILEKIGVPVRVNLPGVGENVQDHIFGGVSFELDPSVPHETFDAFRNPEFSEEQARLQELGQKNRHQYGISALSYLPLSMTNPEGSKSYISRVATFIKEAKAKGALAPGLEDQYDIQLRTLKDDTLPDMEFIGFPGFLTFLSIPERNATHLSILFVSQHPLSRGTIHAKNRNPFEHPDINPHYFENPLDLELLVEHVKYIRKLATTEPLKSSIIREVDPGQNVTDDEDIAEYIRKTGGTCFHAIGSLSMLPQEKNGVVDPNLKVYGTKNLRVADLSIVPIHFAAHTVSTAYAIGEKMADFLRGIHRSGVVDERRSLS